MERFYSISCGSFKKSIMGLSYSSIGVTTFLFRELLINQLDTEIFPGLYCVQETEKRLKERSRHSGLAAFL